MLSALSLPAQSTGGGTSSITSTAPPSLILPSVSEVRDQRSLYAMTAEFYPVTPGDVYSLSYLVGLDSVSTNVIVQSDYFINLSIFGSVDCRGLSFNQLKVLVELKVSEIYPRSMPQFLIGSPGVFQVQIKGEVITSTFFEGWSLTHLSEIINGYLTAYSSIRDIEIINKEGKSNRYDLYKAQRTGDLDQNPHLHIGDTIIVHPYKRSVQVAGQVKRAGTYQLLDGETLESLISVYGAGTTPAADLKHTRITRTSVDIPGSQPETIYLDGTAAGAQKYELRDQDLVYISSTGEYLGSMTFEGALTLTAEEKQASGGVISYARVTYRFTEGEKLSTALKNIQTRFNPDSDLKAAYLLRKDAGASVALNLENILYRYNEAEDFVLARDDRIIIPFKQNFVHVYGAVNGPGVYPWMPTRDYMHYVLAAGGFNIDANAGKAVIIRDRNGKAKSKTDPIEPEDSIYAQSNNAWYVIGRIGIVTGIVASIVAAVAGVISLGQTVGGLVP